MKTFVIVYFYDGFTKFDYQDFSSVEEASRYAELTEQRLNAAGTDVTVTAYEK